ncbi:MAG: Dihydrolipoamide dehydrogenase of pyruvate dehydrogenase complex [uncultured Sphingomonas sp.]|uniref:Dihydrolipoyl dehydrogenase n=1 Tax=uncultured Sphingomonas sp. TaxID=158754 RepID=A0A6J4TI55_9SPHN|nr:dihydrolipoyl dehydrogenase [uncultured Sphingomonas sp.]CAA9524503.1 MAG: Dihydrolipoamide dehydrogenase of pyruvate dehydrogenase complex [uncultured Sphingomonas sp.]
MADQYDVIVLGSGPGGYVAAIRCAQLGLKTAIVERENLGGICLNWGCIPTKALLRSGEVYHQMKHAESYGLSAGQVGFDLAKVVARSRAVAKQLNRGVAGLMKKNKIAVHMGTGKLTAPGKLQVALNDGGTADLEAKHIMIATGARARELPFAKSDGKRLWTYRHAMVPEEMPTDLLVIGSGAIGIEFANFYNDLGARVTVVEMLDRIVPAEDLEISAALQKSLEKQGMTILTSAGIESLKDDGAGVAAKIKAADGTVTDHRFSHCIVAVGIVHNIEGIGLEELGVIVEKGRITIDPYGRTNVPGVWAIGDVTGAPWLAHKASHEGVVAAESIAKELGNNEVHPHTFEASNIPGCTYCHPQVASVGLSEAKAKEAGYEVRVGKFPAIGNGKAIALGETEGFIKTVFDAKTGELLGAHMIGAEVTELIQGYTIGKTAELVEDDFMASIYPHPTLSEMMHESVLAAYDRVLHI